MTEVRSNLPSGGIFPPDLHQFSERVYRVWERVRRLAGSDLFGVRVRISAILIAADFLALAIASVFAYLLASAVWPVPFRSPPGADFLLVAATGYFMGLYAGIGHARFANFLLRLRAVALFACLSLFLWTLAGAVTIAIPYLVLQSAGLVFFGFFFEIFARRLVIERHVGLIPAVIIGDDETARAVQQYISGDAAFGLDPLAVVPVRQFRTNADGEHKGMTPPQSPAMLDGAPVLILADGGDVKDLSFAGDRLMFSAYWTNNAVLRYTGDPVSSRDRLALARVSGGSDHWYRRAKRVLDLLVAVPALIVLSPVILLVALAVKRADPGPAIYKQNRICEGGKLRPIIKIRSMYRDADARLENHLAQNPDAKAEWERYFKLKDDPRILPGIGALIRTTSIDELPQLWNVIRGDMSIVGPRPFPPYHLEQFDAHFQRERCQVPAGLTGYWQITSRSAGDLAAQQAQDEYYLRHRSFFFDLYIILSTVLVILFREGAR